MFSGTGRLVRARRAVRVTSRSSFKRPLITGKKRAVCGKTNPSASVFLGFGTDQRRPNLDQSLPSNRTRRSACRSTQRPSTSIGSNVTPGRVVVTNQYSPSRASRGQRSRRWRRAHSRAGHGRLWETCCSIGRCGASCWSGRRRVPSRKTRGAKPLFGGSSGRRMTGTSSAAARGVVRSRAPKTRTNARVSTRRF